MLLVCLHNDALLEIVALLPDRSLVHFALTCHRFWELFRSDIKHRQYTKLYSTVRLNTHSVHHTADWEHPIQVIAKICEDSRICDYIKKIEFGPKQKGGETGYEVEPDKSTKDLIESTNYLESDIEAFAFLTANEKKAWKKAVRHFDANPCYLVLLSLCKKVTEVALCDRENVSDYLECVIKQMRTETSEALTEPANKAPVRYFPTPTILELSHWDTEFGLAPGDVFHMLQIPGIRDFHGYVLGSDWEPEDWVWPVDLSGCKIENISLVAGTFQPTALIEFMRGFPCLKILTFHEKWDFQDVNDNHNDWETVEEYVDVLNQNGGAFFRARCFEVSFEKDFKTARNSLRRFGSIDVVKVQKTTATG